MTNDELAIQRSDIRDGVETPLPDVQIEEQPQVRPTYPRQIEITVVAASPDYEVLRKLSDSKAQPVRLCGNNYDGMWDITCSEEGKKQHRPRYLRLKLELRT